VDLKHANGKQIVDQLIATADVVTENFRPGALDKLGLGYAELSARHPRLIYCTLKGFLAGPYDHRPALDEVVQMMGGLAYMTGLPDRPLRVGSSVNDIMGGMFGAIGILAALREREKTGRGKLVRSALFENTAFLVAQHMAQKAITGEEPPPMSVKKPAWGIYDIFDTSDDRLFVGVVTDTQWEVFCREFQEPELGSDARLKTNTQRVAERGWMIPRLAAVFRRWRRADLERKLEAIGLPFAPITRPWDLFDDPHLNASGGLAEIRDPRGTTFRTPTLPLELDGKRLPQRANPPALGEGARELLAGLGYSDRDIEELHAARVVHLA
jgi:crotonobetainyl-CoA:carnitine CoA-transferase CaiB-like acyl-CoA transferase